LQIFIPVCSGRHYFVYCINRIHNRIDILDSIDYIWGGSSPEPRHKAIFEKIPIISAAFQKVSKKKFPAIEKWSKPFIEVPKQAGPGDCMFFLWKYMEFWDGDKLNIEINPVRYFFFFFSYIYFVFSICIYYLCVIVYFFQQSQILSYHFFSVQGHDIPDRAHALLGVPSTEPG